jgi:tetratricopeptide (TPR) repeat protein
VTKDTDSSLERNNNLEIALWQAGRLQEVIAQYEHALRIKPDDAGIRANLQLARQALANPQERRASGQR